MVCRNPNRVALKTRLLAFFSSFCFHLLASVFPFPIPNFFLILVAFLLATDQLQLFFTPLFASFCYSISFFQFLPLGIPFPTFFECINLHLSSGPSAAQQDQSVVSLSVRAESYLEAKRC